MNIFLEHMSRTLGNKKAIIVMDCASWHRSLNLIIPQNITLMYLPAYSPELNPVERLWQYRKKHVIKNKLYDSLEELEEAVASFIRGLTPKVISSVCHVNYL